MDTTTQLALLLLCSQAGQSLVYCGQTYCWTRWLDQDDPSGTGDYETLQNYPQSQVCPKPVGIECQTTSGQPYQVQVSILVKMYNTGYIVGIS